jgi:hypothetical protein
VLPASAKRLPEGEHGQDAGKHSGKDAEQQQRRLADLAVRSVYPMPVWSHAPGLSRRPSYRSTRA